MTDSIIFYTCTEKDRLHLKTCIYLQVNNMVDQRLPTFSNSRTALSTCEPPLNFSQKFLLAYFFLFNENFCYIRGFRPPIAFFSADLHVKFNLQQILSSLISPTKPFFIPFWVRPCSQTTKQRWSSDHSDRL